MIYIVIGEAGVLVTETFMYWPVKAFASKNKAEELAKRLNNISEVARLWVRDLPRVGDFRIPDPEKAERIKDACLERLQTNGDPSPQMPDGSWPSYIVRECP